jgi:hypothetical protein
MSRRSNSKHERKPLTESPVVPAAATGSECPAKSPPLPRPGEASGRAGGAAGWNEQRTVIGVCVALASLVWVVFGRTAGYGFVNFDDDRYVYENSHITAGLSMASARWAFTHFHDTNWHPLTTLSHLLDCRWHGLDARWHHATNVALHAAAAVLLFLALRGLTGALWRSAFVAAVFAAHPLHVESVAWISERKDVLSGVFFGLTLCAYGRYAVMQNLKLKIKNEEVRADRCKTWLSYGAVVVCSGLALMCKPTMVTLPFILLLMDWWPLGRISDCRLESGDLGNLPASPLRISLMKRLAGWAPLVWEKAPIFAMSAVVCMLTLRGQRGTVEGGAVIPFSCRAANAAVSYAVYMVETLWPAKLAALYPFRCDALSGWQIGAAGLLLAAVSAAAWVLRRRQPWLAAGWLWYLGTPVPMIGFVQAGMQSHADRYMYLPQTGLVLAVTWMAGAFFARMAWGRMAAGVAGAAIIAALALAAGRQTTYWRNSEALWRRAIDCTEQNYAAHNNLGIILQQRGDTDGAATEYRKALEISPGYADAHNNLAISLQREGKLGEAAAEYARALEINPDLPGAEINLAYVLAVSPDEHLRNGPKAVELAERANLITGGADPRVLGTLATAYASAGRYPDAVAALERALALASSQNNPMLVNQIESDLKRYRAAATQSGAKPRAGDGQ